MLAPSVVRRLCHVSLLEMGKKRLIINNFLSVGRLLVESLYEYRSGRVVLCIGRLEQGKFVFSNQPVIYQICTSSLKTYRDKGTSDVEITHE